MEGVTTVACPKCKSLKTHAGSRGFDPTWGLLKATEVVITCLECGQKFAPGGKLESDKTVSTILLVIAVAVLTIITMIINQP